MNINRLEKLKEMEQQKPDDPFLKFAIAQEFLNLGKDADAECYFAVVIGDYPHYIATYYQFGKLLEKTNRIKEARDMYQKGIVESKLAGDLKTSSELKEALELLDDMQE